MSILYTLRMVRLAPVVLSILSMLTVAGTAALAQQPSSSATTEFELRRRLLDVDDRRHRLDAALEPLDSVLRVLRHDSTHVAAAARPVIVDRAQVRLQAAIRSWHVAPDSAELVGRLVAAAAAAVRAFQSAAGALSDLVVSDSAARDSLARSPNAALVSRPGEPIAREIVIGATRRAGGSSSLPTVSSDEIARIDAAVSDSAFEAYRRALIGAFGARITEVRSRRDSTRAETERLSREGAELAHTIGVRATASTRVDAHAINVGLPVFAVVVVTLLLAPRIYKSQELQHWLFTSGMLLELTTLVMIVGPLLVLALAGKIGEAVIGTVLGGLVGYGVGRGMSRRAGVSAPAIKPVSVSTSNVPVAAVSRRSEGRRYS